MSILESEKRIKKIKKKMGRRVEIVVVIVLLIVSLAHLCRLITGVELVIGETTIPLWVSLLGFVGPASLAGLFWWTRR